MSQRILEYAAGALKNLRKFPEEVQEIAAFALLEAEAGRKHPDAEPLRGFGGAGVLAVHIEQPDETYRVVYTIDAPGKVCVLHAFKKKSKKRAETPKRDMELIRKRYKDVCP